MSRVSAPGFFALVAAGCVSYHQQSALHPAGPQAESIHRLWSTMVPVALAVYVAVLAVLLSIVRRRSAPDDGTAPSRERVARRVVGGAVAASAVIAFAFLVLDFTTGRGLMGGEPRNALTIELTGHRWWWGVRYLDSLPQNQVQLANEIHLPVAEPVRIDLVSHDVIHSFWVPNLGGKKDLIPGHHNDIWLRADAPGVYRSQCAEFCGAEHAKMALYVVAESRAQFEAWLARQRTAPAAPADSVASEGRRIFEAAPCTGCHAIRGTIAHARVGPDLSHLASRLTLAAGTLPNTGANLGSWILDPQVIKPGVAMPPATLTGPQLSALVAYLETLH